MDAVRSCAWCDGVLCVSERVPRRLFVNDSPWFSERCFILGNSCYHLLISVLTSKRRCPSIKTTLTRYSPQSTGTDCTGRGCCSVLPKEAARHAGPGMCPCTAPLQWPSLHLWTCVFTCMPGDSFWKLVISSGMWAPGWRSGRQAWQQVSTLLYRLTGPPPTGQLKIPDNSPFYCL